MEPRKRVLMCRAARRHKEQTFGLSKRRRGRDDLREEHWGIYMTICKMESPGSLMDDAGRGSVTTWGDGVGRGVSGGTGHKCACSRFILMYGKNHHNAVK